MLALGPWNSLQSHSKHSAVPPCKILTLEGVVLLQAGSSQQTQRHRFPPFSHYTNLTWVGTAALSITAPWQMDKFSLQNTPKDVRENHPSCGGILLALCCAATQPAVPAPGTASMLSHTGEQLDWLVLLLLPPA